MQFETRWLGKVVETEKLAPGDLFVHDAGSRAFLGLQLEVPNERPLIVVLAVYGAPDEYDETLQMIYRDAAVPDPSVRRVEGGSLTIEPVERTPGSVFHGSAANNAFGALVLLDDGRTGIRVRTGRGGAIYDLVSGKPVQNLPAINVWQAGWRLVWRFDDDEMELCRFPIT